MSAIEESENGLDINSFFETFFQEASEGKHPVDQTLERIKMRQRLFGEHFASTESFEKYVAAHPRHSVIRRRIESTVLPFPDLDRIGSENQIENLSQQSILEQYRSLVSVGYADAGDVFPEFPRIADLRALRDLLKKFPEEAELIEAEAIFSKRRFAKRWYQMTGEQWTVNNSPSLSLLTSLIAPVPANTVWTEEDCTQEARRMGHIRTAIQAPDQPDNPTALSSEPTCIFDIHDRAHEHFVNRGREHGYALDDWLKAERELAERCESRAVDETVTSVSACSIEEIYRLAGAKLLRQPSKDDDRYTFPQAQGKEGREGFGWGEVIFYDYAVMIPILERDSNLPARSLRAAKLNARFALAVFKFLDDQKLISALGGDDNVAEFKGLLERVIAQKDGDSSNFRELRREAQEMAAVCRSISRQRMLFQPPQRPDIASLITNLETALKPFVPENLKNPERELPRDGHPNSTERIESDPNSQIRIGGVKAPVLEIIDTDSVGKYPYDEVWKGGGGTGRDPRDYFVEERRDLGADREDRPEGWFGLPNTKANSMEGDFQASYGTEIRHKALRRYIQYLGDTFYKRLVALRDSAGALLGNINSINESTDVLADFTRFAEGIINEALLALARLFDGIAETLPQPSRIEQGGQKRLALMLTYRQFWCPQRYVAGKLVGYKSLLPNQRETVKRRTFVKTTREMSTVEEFAAAREEDYTQSSKETAELVKESTQQFNFSISTSGKFNILIAGGDIQTTTSGNFSNTSRATHNRIAEATMKSSVRYNEKREVKIRQLTEIEDTQEVTTEIQNLNREITANYFYYQLFREYKVMTELAEVRPVLLRTRDVPGPAEIDEKFLANYAHILLLELPRQLSVDLQETVGEIEILGRTMVRRRSESDAKAAAYEQFMKTAMPSDAEAQNRWRTELATRESAASDARDAFITAEENYIRARTRIDRVISHVRENLLYYMQRIWHASPTVDQDKLLQGEKFNNEYLDQQTLGFSRLGYYGNEEIFEYTGDSPEALIALAEFVIPGRQVIKDHTTQTIGTHPLARRLKKFHCIKEGVDLLNWIESQVFVRDPAQDDALDNCRLVQMAQDALLVETMPGEVPLLEGFQMAHRVLDVQRACLENLHLKARIEDRPWKERGEDSYKVYRREGEGDELNVQVGKTDETGKT